MTDLHALLGPFEKTPAIIPEALYGAPPEKILLRYQGLALRLLDTTSLLVIEKSRRIGLTWGLAAKAVLTGAAAKSAGGMNVWYMGYDQDMAREFIDVCAMFARAFNIAAAAQDEEIFEDEGGKVQALRIRFASGFKIVALPSVPRVLRGKQGLVILDEAAFYKNLEEVIKAALALLMWGGKVVIVSTHDGVDNPFNVLIEDIKSGKRKGVTHRITFEDALADGLYERIKLTVPGTKPKDEWISDILAFYGDNADEELHCIPKTGSGSWLKPEDVTACEHADAGKPSLYQKGLVYIGRDVARRGDKAVIWPFELVGNMLWLRDRYEERNVRFDAQDAIFDKMFADYRVAKALIDQTGMGEKVVEDAQKRHGNLRVEGVIFSGPAKLDLATSLRQRVESGTIRFPHDPVIRADFRAIKRTGGSGNGLVEEGSVHADMFWAAALACRAAELGQVQVDFKSTGEVRPSAGGYGAGEERINRSVGWGSIGGGDDTRGF